MIWEVLVIGGMCIVCFIVGAKVGQKTVKGETILPIKTPIQFIEEVKENREQRKENERNRILSENIDNYDGTDIGQQNLPR